MRQHLNQKPIRRFVRLLLRGYQLFVSPLLGNHCRYYPSCSQYAIEAVEQHGVIRGVLLAVLRLLRCHPWHPGGVDPVPTVFSLRPGAALDADCPTCGPRPLAHQCHEARPDQADPNPSSPTPSPPNLSHQSGETANRPMPPHMKSRRPEYHG